MKKLIILLVAAFSFTAGFAQNRQYDRNQPYPVYGSNDRYENNGGYNKRDRRYDDRGYDQRDYGRRNDRYNNRRHIPAPPPPPPVVYERRQPDNFGKGVAVGAIGALILGAILSR